MKTRNYVQLIGYLGEDPEIQISSTGKAWAHLRLATDYYRKKDDGTVTRKTTWHDITIWNKLTKILPGNFIKGSHIMVEGELCYRTFFDHIGHKRYITEILATKLMNLDR